MEKTGSQYLNHFAILKFTSLVAIWLITFIYLLYTISMQIGAFCTYACVAILIIQEIFHQFLLFLLPFLKRAYENRSKQKACGSCSNFYYLQIPYFDEHKYAHVCLFCGRKATKRHNGTSKICQDCEGNRIEQEQLFTCRNEVFNFFEKEIKLALDSSKGSHQQLIFSKEYSFENVEIKIQESDESASKDMISLGRTVFFHQDHSHSQRKSRHSQNENNDENQNQKNQNYCQSKGSHRQHENDDEIHNQNKDERKSQAKIFLSKNQPQLVASSTLSHELLHIWLKLYNINSNKNNSNIKRGKEKNVFTDKLPNAEKDAFEEGLCELIRYRFLLKKLEDLERTRCVSRYFPFHFLSQIKRLIVALYRRNYPRQGEIPDPDSKDWERSLLVYQLYKLENEISQDYGESFRSCLMLYKEGISIIDLIEIMRMRKGGKAFLCLNCARNCLKNNLLSISQNKKNN